MDSSRGGGRGSGWPYAFLPEKVGEGLIGPILPIFAASLAGATAARIGLMEATFQAMAVLGAFAWGRTSDEVGKRKAIILLGFLGSAVSLAGMAFSNSFWVLFAWRAVFGFVAAGFGALGGALVADRASPETIGDQMGFMRAVGGGGYVAGLVAGALVVAVRPTFELFAAAAALTFVSGLLAWVWIEEPTSHLSRSEVARLFRNVSAPVSMGVQRRLYNPTVFLQRPRLEGTQRRAWAYLGAIALSFLGTTAGFVLFPLYLVGIGIPPAGVFALFILNASLSALLYRPMGRLADRIGYRPMQIGAVGARSAMFLVLLTPVLPGLPAAAVFLGMAGISWAVLHVTGPTALFRGMQIRQTGELMGLYQMAAGTGSLAGALLGGFLAETAGYTILFAVAAGVVGLAVVVLALVVYPSKPSRTPSQTPGAA